MSVDVVATRPLELIAARARRTAAVSEALTWLCGGALALNLLLMIGILGLLTWHGLAYFWQHDLHQLELRDGNRLLGEIWEVDQRKVALDRPATDRLRLKIGNRDVGGLDFAWIDRKDIRAETRPPQAVMLERLEWGNFYGTMAELRRGGAMIAAGPDATWRAFWPLLREKESRQEP